MCRLCAGPPADKSVIGTCDHCFHWGVVYHLQRRPIPPESPWPGWKRKTICRMCIDKTLLTAA